MLELPPLYTSPGDQMLVGGWKPLFFDPVTRIRPLVSGL